MEQRNYCNGNICDADGEGKPPVQCALHVCLHFEEHNFKRFWRKTATIRVTHCIILPVIHSFAFICWPYICDIYIYIWRMFRNVALFRQVFRYMPNYFYQASIKLLRLVISCTPPSAAPFFVSNGKEEKKSENLQYTVSTDWLCPRCLYYRTVPNLQINSNYSVRPQIYNHEIVRTVIWMK